MSSWVPVLWSSWCPPGPGLPVVPAVSVPPAETPESLSAPPPPTSLPGSDAPPPAATPLSGGLHRDRDGPRQTRLDRDRPGNRERPREVGSDRINIHDTWPYLTDCHFNDVSVWSYRPQPSALAAPAAVDSVGPPIPIREHWNTAESLRSGSRLWNLNLLQNLKVLTISSVQIHIGPENSSAGPTWTTAASKLDYPVYPVLQTL